MKDHIGLLSYCEPPVEGGGRVSHFESYVQPQALFTCVSLLSDKMTSVRPPTVLFLFAGGCVALLVLVYSSRLKSESCFKKSKLSFTRFGCLLLLSQSLKLQRKKQNNLFSTNNFSNCWFPAVEWFILCNKVKTFRSLIHSCRGCGCSVDPTQTCFTSGR